MFHITICFLGETDPVQVFRFIRDRRAVEQLEVQTHHFRPISVKLAREPICDYAMATW